MNMEIVNEWAKYKQTLLKMDKDAIVSDKTISAIKNLINDEDITIWVIWDKDAVNKRLKEDTTYETALIVRTIEKPNVEHFVFKNEKLYNVHPAEILKIMREFENNHPEFKRDVKAIIEKKTKTS